MEKSYKEYLKHITTFIFDVDGVLTDGNMLVNTEGEMFRSMNVKDGYAMKLAIEKGYKICIISGGTNEGVRVRLQNLGVGDIYLGSHKKIEKYHEILKKHNINAAEILYMGDDMPDIPVMQEIGLPTCPQDAVPQVKAVSKYVSHKKGGRGCVRDVIEQVLKVQGKWDITGGPSSKLD
ncbi:KdsC family phosphatase [Aequorivita echinoideorum]|uniref:HAD-IIIA family hydrolase n=1 Tax=Aequorivita echinoideorum TaxID=1549647 RepID=A0ABS5S7D8_9FLAO|nr:HAD-IIIA family hydrolase [Aequorivita echinoideorum]MBT0608898.1 HAD-IIIA family hydrolase [Aequorivita echinoideorum]